MNKTLEANLLAALQATAAGVIVGMCKSSPWLGLQRDDLVHEGWLAYQAALTRGDALRGDPNVYAMNAAWHAMRTATRHWLRSRKDVPLVQVEQFDRLPAERALPADPNDALEIATAYLLNRLSTRRRAILMSLYYDARSVRETALLLRLPPATVSRQRYAALEQLRTWAGRKTPATRAAHRRTAAWVERNKSASNARHARYNATEARRAANRAYKARQRAKKRPS